MNLKQEVLIILVISAIVTLIVTSFLIAQY